jgi:pilus assembly protein CpaB
MISTRRLPKKLDHRWLLAIALVSGLVAAALVFIALQDSDDGKTVAPSASDTVKVVVASRDIAPGSEVKEDMLRVIDVPNDLRIAGAFTESAPIVGEVTNVAIASGEQITSKKIGPTVDEGIGQVVTLGQRGLSVEIEEATAVGGLLLPGDRVDVIATYEKTTDGLSGDTTTVVRTVLQDVEILAVAQSAQEAVGISEDAEGTSLPTSGIVPDDVDTEPDASTVTLSVTPDQALILAGVQDDPDVIRVWLAVRPSGETVGEAPQGVEVPALFE